MRMSNSGHSIVTRKEIKIFLKITLKTNTTVNNANKHNKIGRKCDKEMIQSKKIINSHVHSQAICLKLRKTNSIMKANNFNHKVTIKNHFPKIYRIVLTKRNKNSRIYNHMLNKNYPSQLKTKTKNRLIKAKIRKR